MDVEYAVAVKCDYNNPIGNDSNLQKNPLLGYVEFNPRASLKILQVDRCSSTYAWQFSFFSGIVQMEIFGVSPKNLTYTMYFKMIQFNTSQSLDEEILIFLSFNGNILTIKEQILHERIDTHFINTFISYSSSNRLTIGVEELVGEWRSVGAKQINCFTSPPRLVSIMGGVSLFPI